MAEEIAYARIARTEVVWVEGVINFEQKRAFCSIYVTGFRAKTKPADLIVHFRDTKNGGGDIDKVIFNKRGGAVIIFHNPEVVKSVLQREHEFEGVTLTVKNPLKACTNRFEHILDNGVKISLYQSNIADEQVGAIIIAANNILLPGGDVASAIVQKGGHQTNEESRRIMADRSWRPLNVGDAVHTKSGNLSCQYIIHAICPTWSSRYQSLCISLLEQACMESFRLAAHQLGLCSITLSAIGTDKVFGIPQEISAQVMYDALEEFSSSTEAKFSTLREVRIVIIDEETMSVFREEFIRRYVLQQTLPATNVTYQGFPPKENTENFQGGNLRKGSCKRGIKALTESTELKTKSVPETKTEVTAASISSNLPKNKQASVEQATHKNKELTEHTTPAAESKYPATDEEQPAESGITDKIPPAKNDSKQTIQGNDVNNNWREVESDLARMRQALDEENLARNIRKQELKQKETVLINKIKNTLCEEQQARARVEEELSQSRIACNELEERLQNDLVQLRQTLDNEASLRNTKEQELRERETVVDELQKTLLEEQQTRSRVGEELKQARTLYNELEGRSQNEIAQIRQTLDSEIDLRNMRERELREMEAIADQLQKTSREEKQARTEVTEQLREARSVCNELEERCQNEMLSKHALQQELQTKESALGEQRRLLEEERNQKTTLEERLRNLEIQMQEERDRHISTERELQSAVSLAQEELTEYQRRQPRDWTIQREEVRLSGNILGKGAWGNVRKGTFRSCQVAVKEIHELILSPHNRRLFEREMSIASCCRHPNLLQFIGATNDDGSPLFVTELLDTSLRHVLSQRALNRDEIIGLSLDVAKGLNYLHLNKPLPIIHRDISSANVLLWKRDECWRAKLSDYGSANFLRQTMTVNAGAVIYSAPEASTSRQSPKVDVYSFGVLLCEMCIRELPVPQEIHDQVGQVTDSSLQGLIQRCVQRDPEARPSMGEVTAELEELASNDGNDGSKVN